MEKLEATVSTFDKYAEQYQPKYLNYAPYAETCEALSNLITKDDAESVAYFCRMKFWNCRFTCALLGWASIGPMDQNPLG